MLTKPKRTNLEIRTMKVGRQTLRVGIKPGPSDVPPLLLFNGIGASLELASTFMQSIRTVKVIIFDVPGIGGSPGYDLPYRLPTIARLSADLVRALGHDEVDVAGISWGGALAQQFARQFPRLCRKLVLMATAPGSIMVPAKLSVLLKLISPRRYVDRSYMAAIAAEIYGGAFLDDPALVASHANATTAINSLGYFYQLLAAAGWSSLPWLHSLRQPTLVLSGNDDPIVRPINGWILSILIPNSTFEVLDDGHLFVISQPDAVAKIVESFLRK
jgi:poly(3-hydroxyalkanoate) depolymerase